MWWFIPAAIGAAYAAYKGYKAYKAYKDMAKTFSYDENNAESIKTMSELLAELKNIAIADVQKEEDILIKAIDNFFTECIKEIPKQKDEKKLELVKQQLKHTQEISINNIKGTIQNAMMQKVSIDNEKCVEILKLPKGKEKESKYKAFVVESIKESMIELAKRLIENLSECKINTIKELRNNLDSIKQNHKTQKEKLEALKGENVNKNMQQIQTLRDIWLSKYIINITDYKRS